MANGDKPPGAVIVNIDGHFGNWRAHQNMPIDCHSQEEAQEIFEEVRKAVDKIGRKYAEKHAH